MGKFLAVSVFQPSGLLVICHLHYFPCMVCLVLTTIFLLLAHTMNKITNKTTKQYFHCRRHINGNCQGQQLPPVPISLAIHRLTITFNYPDNTPPHARNLTHPHIFEMIAFTACQSRHNQDGCDHLLICVSQLV